MNFALILVILSALSGLIYFLDWVYFSKKRTTAAPGKVIENARSLFPVFLIVLLLRSFLAEPFRIPSGSLEPTLNVGDFVVVNKFIYGLRLPVLETKIIKIKEPKTGDIAVFRWPPNPEYDYIKRVIGTPHDKIAYKNKVLYINGQKMKRTFVGYTTDESSGKPVKEYQEDLAGVKHKIYINPDIAAYDFEVTVPEGYYFMMGDNRDDSADSRYWGFVAEENLRGKALAVWMSWNHHTSMPRWSNIGHIIV